MSNTVGNTISAKRNEKYDADDKSKSSSDDNKGSVLVEVSVQIIDSIGKSSPSISIIPDVS